MHPPPHHLHLSRIFVQLSLLECTATFSPTSVSSTTLSSRRRALHHRQRHPLVINIYSHPDALDFRTIHQGFRTGNACSVFVIVTDFVMFAFPATMVWKLQIPLRTRLAVIGMFAL